MAETSQIKKLPLLSKLPSISAVTYKNGVGFLGSNPVPVAFQSYNSFLVFWNVTQRYQMICGTPFSLNGLPVSTAVCVRGAGVVGLGWLLYVAPNQAPLASNYMASWLNAVPGANTGPVVTVASGVGYVAIASQGVTGLSCNPNMNKLTQLGT